MEISTSLILSMAFAALVSIGGPIAYMIYCKKAVKASLVPVVAGITVYLVAVIGFESMVHQFFIYGSSTVADFINSNKWVYVLYLGICTAVFEQAGRWLAFKFMLKKYTPEDTALTYGIGHGAAQTVVPIGIGLAISAAMLYSVKSTGYEEYLAMIGEDQAATFNEMLMSYTSTGAHYYMWTALEMLMVLVVQVGLSVLVAKSVRRANSTHLLFIAAALHFVFTSVGALSVAGIVTSIAVVEIGCLIIAVVIALYAFYEYSKDKSGKDVLNK